MKSFLRRTSTLVLAIALSISLSALAGPPQKNRGGAKSDGIVGIIKKIQKILRIAGTDDLPLPPHPTPPPPSTTT